MNFFKSVFADEPPLSADDPHSAAEDEPNASGGAWSFGGLMTTLATKSESVIHNYRRDLEEFGSELKKETAVIRQVASRAVKDLPGSLEAGASVAQESLETVGQAIDDIGTTVWKSTAEIITHGRDAILADDDVELESDNNDGISVVDDEKRLSSSGGSDLRKYSRFEAQVKAIEGNLNTYLEEPDDLEGYGNWGLGFVLDEKREQVEDLMRENGVVSGIHGEIVPSKVDNDSFWRRYFYRVHKLKEVEDARAKLVKRAISGEEEDLSWDFDDEDDDGYVEKGKGKDVKAVGSSGSVELELDKEMPASSEGNARESDGGEIPARESVSDSCKESDVSIISSQPSMPGEEDLGWDEIEAIGSSDENKGDDENKGSASGSATRADFHNRVSAEDEEEDLSWDIEDDDDDDGGGEIRS